MENYSKVELVNKGRKLAFLLRHDVEAYEKGKIEENGWRCVDELLELGFTRPQIEEIVETNKKKRYEFNTDKTKIRARQGHSIPVDVELEKRTPPKYLYHGTSEATKDSILNEGIKSMNRLFVHLSEDIETAKKVGKRHGNKVVVFVIDAEKMVGEGHVFYLSRNNVWLTNHVDAKYIYLK